MSMWWASVVSAACGEFLASSAIRCRRVEMVSELGVPGICPSSGLMARRPLPSAGSLGSVPPRRRYPEALRLPVARPTALRCLREAVPRLPPSFAAAAAGLELVTRYLRPGFAVKAAGPPRFLGDPPRACPVLRPRRDRGRQALAASRCGLPSTARRRLPRAGFRGSRARPARSLSPLRSPGYPGTTQDSLPAAGQALPGGAGYPQGPNERFPRHNAFPFPKLSWRTQLAFLPNWPQYWRCTPTECLPCLG